MEKSTLFYDSSYDEYDECLEHHGIKGMHWGIRRYQNKDGTLTKAGEKKYGTTENLKNNVTKQHEAAKKKAIASGDPKEVAKYVSELTTPQLNDAWSRVDKVQKIKAAIPPPKPSVAKKLLTAVGVGALNATASAAEKLGSAALNAAGNVAKSVGKAAIDKMTFKESRDLGKRKKEAKLEGELAAVREHQEEIARERFEKSHDKKEQAIKEREAMIKEAKKFVFEATHTQEAVDRIQNHDESEFKFDWKTGKWIKR